jgi:hypothetical protein
VRMVMRCAVPGCDTLGLGRLCIKHEPKLTRVFVRGRPWPPAPIKERVERLASVGVRPAPQVH